jgi:hypothetical protein
MRFYGTAGIITFMYQNPQDCQEVELPVIFDEDYEAESTFQEIVQNYEDEKDVYISEYPAYIPPTMLYMIKRSLDIRTREPFSEFSFERKDDH